MAKKQLPVFAFIGFFILVGLANSMFIVSQTEQALVVRFGKAVDLEATPRLKFKVPFVDEARIYEKRTLVYRNDKSMTVILADQDRLIVDAFIAYKITDPLQYFEAAPTDGMFKENLKSIVEKSLRDVMGKELLTTLLSPKRSGIMKEIQQRVSLEAQGNIVDENGKTADKQQGFGIEVVDVRIMRTDLPQETSAAIYNRMRSDRQKVAEKFRAEGQRESQIIRSEADKTRTIILAEAEKKSQTIRGEGEGQATKIFAESFGQDREFFDFYRTMQAYKASIGKEDTTMVLSPDNSFLKHMEK